MPVITWVIIAGVVLALAAIIFLVKVVWRKPVMHKPEKPVLNVVLDEKIVQQRTYLQVEFVSSTNNILMEQVERNLSLNLLGHDLYMEELVQEVEVKPVFSNDTDPEMARLFTMSFVGDPQPVIERLRSRVDICKVKIVQPIRLMV